MTSIDPLDKGFQLAHFILPDREHAIQVLIAALERLRTQCLREQKRFYWRDKNPRDFIRRTTRSDLDTLQWLILFESEPFERQYERDGNQMLEHMIIRYVKYLIRISTPASSFYVAIALGRLLRNYSTQETQHIYEGLTERYLGADQYRRAKSSLLTKVQERFGSLLNTISAVRGELRFETLDNQAAWIALVDEALTHFTPWSTAEACSHEMAIGTSAFPIVTGPNPTDRDTIETSCCHVLIEPVCFRHLLRKLALDAHETRLALPRFVIKTVDPNNGGYRQHAANTPELSDGERNGIAAILAKRDSRRRKIRPQSVTVSVDGVECGDLDLAQTNKQQITLPEGATLIDIRGTDELGELILVTHLIRRNQGLINRSRSRLTLRNGRIDLDILAPDTSSGSQEATLLVEFRPRIFAPFPKNVSWRPLFAFTFTGLASALIAWTVATSVYNHRLRQLQHTIVSTKEPLQTGNTNFNQQLADVILTRDDQILRGSNNGAPPQITLHNQAAVIKLGLPIKGMRPAEWYRISLVKFPGNEELLTISSLRIEHGPEGPYLLLPVPANILEPSSYYTARLFSGSDPARTQEIGRFTFHVARE